ncbi:carbohydrate kinase FGGY [Thermobaculum terrenum ATCC BAA-798]|uniref:Carbohydrate kinase FGGY n=1 Tax=Thermobaculum terrenum (strain ATCC BAA-798 / CCMEE 7001 / YNP1) TaxID=525904 RepID=D1CHZ9_THET1|nr:FGGY-family carbohydrate kinase [Thermobaculum terrenum]ACZ43370.1 carbohydrate kinase FGGY [Thermobaculum terrenum ATCC BAA-798]
MLIGVDAGTSVVKAVAFSEQGEVLGIEAESNRVLSPAPGLFEQDQAELISKVGQVVSRLTSRLPHRVEVIGITAQGDGLWLLDRNGDPLGHAILWLDSRAIPVVERWLEEGVVEAVARRHGNVLFPGASASILAYLDRHEPERLAAAGAALYCKDVLVHALTGAVATDPSDASLPFLDVRSRRYDEDIVRLCGLSAWRHLLPPVDPLPGPLRALNRKGAALLGLPQGTPVHAGPFDLPACALGLGLRRDVGEALVILGTTLACEVVVDSPPSPTCLGGMTLCFVDPDRWLRAMPAMVGTACLDWLTRLLGLRPQDLDSHLDASPIGARGVMVLPHLSPGGERAPVLDMRARGVLAGLHLHVERADLVRALCEGIACTARHCLESAGWSGGPIYLCGGGARSQRLCQLLADVLGHPVLVPRVQEAGARGAAIAAGIALGGISFDEWRVSIDVVEPNEDCRQHYLQLYEQHLRLEETCRELSKMWSSTAID